jgi:type II secretory ATPase GspE/PulE/Tfp pilus assembly ATPase PilB-like protein
METEILKEFKKVIRQSTGMVLVVGPTGCGKTTTLYAALSDINSVDKNIMTIEDPVEYRLPTIRQTQINPKAGFTFANALRSMLRHDPDVILVGEIRDTETAAIAIQAALTGHLVFSTLHTNNAIESISRLIDMEIEPFLVTSSVIAVLAQRLVRKLCPECKESYKPSQGILQTLDLSGKEMTFYRGKGCPSCHNTGYKDDFLRQEIIQKKPSFEISRLLRDNGMITLRQAGIRKACEGFTSLEEVLRVTPET